MITSLLSIVIGQGVSGDPFAHRATTSEPTNRADRSAYGRRVVGEALKFIGTPYKFGGASLKSGVDASHFVELVLKSVGGPRVPAPTHQQEAYGEVVYATAGTWHRRGKKDVVGPVGSMNDLLPGDRLIYFSEDSKGAKQHHTAIYAGSTIVFKEKTYKNVIIEASGSKGVTISPASRNRSRLRYVLRDPIPQTFKPD